MFGAVRYFQTLDQPGQTRAARLLISRLLEPSRFRGCLDRCNAHFISGWIANSLGPRIVVSVNGIPQGEVTPWIERRDVKALLEVEARGFFFVFPRRLSPGNIVRVSGLNGRAVRRPVAYTIRPFDQARDFLEGRASLAAQFLRGYGIEIGPYTMPTDLPPDRDLVFYDRFAAPELRAYYDDRCGLPLFEPHLTGNAEGLDGIADQSLDFVIANHVIEHMQDPIRFLKTIAKALKPGGCALIAAPDKRHTFDLPRPLTTFEHLLADHREGPHRSKRDHILELLRLVDRPPLDEIEAFAAKYDKDDQFVHFHVWDDAAFLAFVRDTITTFTLPLDVVFGQASHKETIAVLKKHGRS